MSIRLTGFGYLVLGLTLVALLMSANFSNNLLFVVACLWLSVLVTSIVMTVFQFRRLQPVGWRFDELYARSRNPVSLSMAVGPQELPLNLVGSQTLLWVCEPEHCGRQALVPPRLQSHDPLGCWQVSRPAPELSDALVFPAPVAHQAHPEASENADHRLQNGDDIHQIRAYQAGDSYRTVDWKATARSGRWQVREMSGDPEQTALWLEWDSLAGLDPVQRQETLCAWILALNERGARWGLLLPTRQVALNTGEAHKRRCLEALVEATA